MLYINYIFLENLCWTIRSGVFNINVFLLQKFVCLDFSSTLHVIGSYMSLDYFVTLFHSIMYMQSFFVEIITVNNF